MWRIIIRDNLVTVQGNNLSWDKQLRENFFHFVIKHFCEYFETTEDVAKKYVFVEGFNPIPSNFRKVRFFGSSMYPDAALIFDNEIKIAIELDHGYKGSQIRNALFKASLSVLLGIFHSSMLFFLVKSKSRSDISEISEKEQQIVDFFQKEFSTMLYIL